MASICIKSERCQAYCGCHIYKEWDKSINPDTQELFGRVRMYYAIYVPDGKEEILTESFNTLKEAKKYIDSLSE